MRVMEYIENKRMSSNDANRSSYEVRKEAKEQAKKIKSPDTLKQFGYKNIVRRMEVFCKSEVARDTKVAKLRLENPLEKYELINPK